MSTEKNDSLFNTLIEKKPVEPVFTETPKNRPGMETILKHLGLFLLTFISVSIVSVFLVGTPSATLMLGFIPYPDADNLYRGVLFASLLLSFLTFHEFGHYFAAVYHKVKVTLPYYIPIPVGIGTLGAVIRIKEQIHETRKLFDIGVAGPIAGFIVSVLILLIGFMTLPDAEFLNEFGDHNNLVEYYEQNGEYPTEPELIEGQSIFLFGGTGLYNFIASFFDGAPPLWEIQHYPWLLAGWFGLFFTALNLMPVGQLDGGHILYSLIGYKKHKYVARLFFFGITILAGISAVPFIHVLLENYDNSFGVLAWLIWTGLLFLIMQKAFRKEQYWVASLLPASLISSGIYLYLIAEDSSVGSSLIWVFWTIFISFVIKVEHPPVLIETPLSPTRKVIGWVSMLIFVLCISFNPISIK